MLTQTIDEKEEEKLSGEAQEKDVEEQKEKKPLHERLKAYWQIGFKLLELGMYDDELANRNDDKKQKNNIKYMKNFHEEVILILKKPPIYFKLLELALLTFGMIMLDCYKTTPTGGRSHEISYAIAIGGGMIAVLTLLILELCNEDHHVGELILLMTYSLMCIILGLVVLINCGSDYCYGKVWLLCLSVGTAGIVMMIDFYREFTTVNIFIEDV